MPSLKKSKAISAQPSADIVDGKLVLSLPNAITPVVWQMDINRASSSAIEVIEKKNKGGFTLNFKTNDSNTEIATFENRNDAMDALIMSSEALKTAHGKIQTSANENHTIIASQPNLRPEHKKSKGVMGWIFGVLVILILGFVLLLSLIHISEPTRPY